MEIMRWNGKFGVTAAMERAISSQAVVEIATTLKGGREAGQQEGWKRSDVARSDGCRISIVL